MDRVVAGCVKPRLARTTLCVKWLNRVALSMLCVAAWGSDRIFIEGEQLVHQKDDVRSTIATGLYAVADLHVSYDATTLLLTAKKSVADHWQIFELRVD